MTSKLRERGVLALAIMSLTAAPAMAQTTYYRGPDGRDAGRMERGSDGSTRLYDSTGRPAGEVVQRPAPGAAWRPSSLPLRSTAPLGRD